MATDNLAVLNLPPEASVIEIFNEANGIQLLDSDAILEVLATDSDQVAGKILVRSRQDPNDLPRFKNAVNVRWRRLDLAQFFTFDLQIPLPLPSNTLALVTELARRTGLLIDGTDVVLETITVDMGRSYLLKARPTSFRWYGEVAITLLDLIDLSIILPAPVALADLGVSPDYPNAWVADYGGDLNGNLHTAVWNALTVGTVVDATSQSAALVAALQAVLINLDSPTLWINSVTPDNNNLYGASVLYNGPLIGYLPPPFNTSLTNCVRILLNPTSCLTPVGIVTIFYNPAFSPGKQQ